MMKIERIVILVAVIVSGFFLQALNVAYNVSATVVDELIVEIKPESSSLQLGETGVVQTRVINRSSKSLQVSRRPYVKIAFDSSKNFELYAPMSAEFVVDGASIPLTLGPGESFAWQTSILWNDKPAVSHLNSDAAKRSTDGRVLTDYAFPEPGRYFIRVGIAIVDNHSRIIRSIESEPSEILVTSPTGLDHEVWEKMKVDANIGYFMQEGDIPRTFQYKTKERDELLKEIDSILEQYPNSIYAATLRQSRDTFRSNEAQRQQSRRKLLGPK